MQLDGYEETYFTTTSTSDDSHNNTRHGHLEFFKVNVPLGGPGNLSPGQYQFGFQFVLPPNIPGSFHVSRGGDRGDITYKCKAAAHKFGFAVKCEQVITVAQSYPASNAVTNSANTSINMCCCIPSGNASAQATLEKDTYSGGEVINVVVQARNNSSNNFGVEAILKRHVTLTTGQNGYYRDHWTETVCKAATQGLGPNEVAEGNMARCIQLMLPPNIAPTANGVCIKAHYTVEVVMNASNPFASDVVVSLPVMINSGPPQVDASAMYQSPPQDWKPSKVYQDVHINVPTNDVPVAPPQVMGGALPPMQTMQPQGAYPQPVYQPPPMV